MIADRVERCKGSMAQCCQFFFFCECSIILDVGVGKECVCPRVHVHEYIRRPKEATVYPALSFFAVFLWDIKGFSLTLELGWLLDNSNYPLFSCSNRCRRCLVWFFKWVLAGYSSLGAPATKPSFLCYLRFLACKTHTCTHTHIHVTYERRRETETDFSVLSVLLVEGVIIIIFTHKYILCVNEKTTIP